MKMNFLALVFFSSLAYGQDLQIRNFNFTYLNNFGEGSATTFSYQPATNNAVQVTLEKVGDMFSIKTTGAEEREFEFKDAPSFMQSAEKMTVKSFNVHLQDRATLTLGEGHFVSPDDELYVQGVSLDCTRDRNQVELMDQMINGCIRKMNVKVSRYNSSDESAVINEFVSAFEQALSQDIQIQGKTDIRSLDLTVDGGRYDLVADVRAQISGKVRSKGTLAYEPGLKRLTIRINEVKFGILNITSKVFDELRQKESDKLKVRQPFVYLTVK